ncbi:MAG: ribosome biogenesis GTP-binding protein YihA/YsxC [Lachnospiraceae bacterium]|jgi:GTP-binding protein|nr:ribosome biogenesis GTP-binding protein YihA/YsxC [Lachnospiraceae bacterium]
MGEWNIKSAELQTVIGPTSKVPENPFPEFAFAGRSNVGKSSLINSLMNRKSLARTSSKPGKTQTINFYLINKSLYFVDLPGYGFATAPVAEKERWGRMVERYLKGSKTLAMVFLLADIRHDPSPLDKQMFEWVRQNGFCPAVIATKADKVKPSQRPKHLKAIREGLGMEKDGILIPFSALDKSGREQIWEVITGATGNDGAAP